MKNRTRILYSYALKTHAREAFYNTARGNEKKDDNTQNRKCGV
jgi:hypothetical protein